MYRLIALVLLVVSASFAQAGGGATLTLTARSVDGLGIVNRNAQDAPIQTPSDAIKEARFDGQLIQIDVVSKRRIKTP